MLIEMAFFLTPHPSAVAKIRKARLMSQEAVAIEANVPLAIIEQIETAPKAISKRMAFSVAKSLAVPIQSLFSDDVEVDTNIPDFRTAGNRPAVLTSSGLARLARTRSITNYLADGAFDQDARFQNVGTVKVGDTDRAISLISTLYRPVRSSSGAVNPQDTFRETRVSLESSGIIVLCDRVGDAFRGFCYAMPREFPVIFVNTSGQRPATKLFTLLHEAVHVVTGSTGISDPSILNNRLERFCNSVAAAVMMPSAEFQAYYSRVKNRDVRSAVDSLSRQFGASKQATALRVTDLGIDAEFYAKWSASLPAKVPPIQEEDEDESDGGGGGISSQIARFGYLLPNMLIGAVKSKAISQYDAYRLTNLKPSTISQIAEIGANRLGQ
ncbi:XRE family transcriptional regulator [Mesorhizobium sp.]|uniref:XRE family transcriptional regulator n=1 Tax=Mesorhizobium sp. TaxID=1871066 RepID=UPI000FE46C40|nr:XRE family transcriptional regulator [Mesorhizobium sp.]RWD79740.1 MAG: ImmA/IrrE family metallo-endopeptidase [Mesorhizobium sp.]